MLPVTVLSVVCVSAFAILTGSAVAASITAAIAAAFLMYNLLNILLPFFPYTIHWLSQPGLIIAQRNDVV